MDLCQGMDLFDAHVAQLHKGPVAQPGDLADGQRVQEGLHFRLFHIELPVGLALVGGHLGHGLVHRQPEGNGQPRFPGYALPELVGIFERPIKPIHAGHVDVMLVDAGLFEQGDPFPQYVGDLIGGLGVFLHAPPYENGMRAEHPGHPRRHGGAHPELPCLVAA